MSGESMFGVPAKYFRQDVSEFFSTCDITAALRTRLISDEINCLKPMTLVATGRAKLLLFSRQKIVKEFTLPFSDCNTILVYRNRLGKEFLITRSGAAAGATAIIDLLSSKVTKKWEKTKKVEIKDEKLMGWPQILVYLRNGTTDFHKIVTFESDWEEEDCDPLHSNTCNSSLKDVVQALQSQLKNTQGHILALENQISQRQSLVNRYITAVREATTNRNSFSGPPSYSTELIKGNSLKNSPPTFESEINWLKRSLVWYFTLNETCVFGTTFTNFSAKLLSNVQCFLNLFHENTTYRVHYYVFSATTFASSPLPSNEMLNEMSNEMLNEMSNEKLNEMLTLLKTDLTFDGKLKSQQSVTVVVVSSIPVFAEKEVEVGNLFVSFTLLDRPELPFQLPLGSLRLRFDQICSRSAEFNPFFNDMTEQRRNVLGLLSVLQSEKRGLFSTTFSLASDSFAVLCKAIEMQYFALMQCYYGEGFYGHVCVLTHAEEETQMKIIVRAESEKKMRWFIQRLKSSLPNGCSFLLESGDEPKEIVSCPLRHLSSAISLLSGAEEEVNTDESPVVVEEQASSTETPLDKIRQAFLQKHAQTLALSQGKSGNLKMPFDSYQQFQSEYFTSLWK